MKNLTILLMVFLVLLNACASYIPVNPEPENVETMIKKGDELKIMTKNNEEIELKVDYLTNEAIIGKKKTVQFSDISKLEKMTSSTASNIVGGILGAIFVGLLISLEAALHSDDQYYYDPDDPSPLGLMVEGALDSIFFGCHPDFHPGDLFYQNNTEYAVDYKNDLDNCENNCPRNTQCINNVTSFDCESKSQLEIKSCVKACIENKQYPIARHIEDGYYSDGSYYKNCDNDSDKYENTHSLKNSYSKNQWQSVRDECMEITDKENNIKADSLFKKTSEINKRKKDFYNTCIQDNLTAYGSINTVLE